LEGCKTIVRAERVEVAAAKMRRNTQPLVLHVEGQLMWPGHLSGVGGKGNSGPEVPRAAETFELVWPTTEDLVVDLM
jgi:hypothetical protein